MATHPLNKMAYDSEAKSGSTYVTCSRRICPVKSLEDPGEGFSCNPLPFIRYFDVYEVTLNTSGCDLDDATLLAVSNCILKKIA